MKESRTGIEEMKDDIFLRNARTLKNARIMKRYEKYLKQLEIECKRLQWNVTNLHDSIESYKVNNSVAEIDIAIGSIRFAINNMVWNAAMMSALIELSGL